MSVSGDRTDLDALKSTKSAQSAASIARAERGARVIAAKNVEQLRAGPDARQRSGLTEAHAVAEPASIEDKRPPVATDLEQRALERASPEMTRHDLAKHPAGYEAFLFALKRNGQRAT